MVHHGIARELTEKNRVMTDFAESTERWTPEPIADGTYLIDLGFQRVPGTIGSFLLAANDELALIETGPTTTVANLAKGVSEAGFDLADVSRLIVSHIHLDHAGAAGTLMRMNPTLRLSVHASGAPYLIDPERLVKSAARIFGDRMDRLWGEVEPVDADRVDTMDDGDVISAGGHDLLVRHAPGHAGSHVVLLDRSTGVLFTGDAAGARLRGTTYVCPTLVPPELDVTVWAQTLDMMKGLGATKLALTHCGAFDDVERHLGDVIPNLEEQIAIGESVMVTPEDDDAVIEFLIAQEREEYVREGGDLREVNAWMRAMGLAMPPYVAAQGLKRIFRKAGRFG
jgi:glyoxylase-like metal-dependent hydrolase (beta-lactamase superfamily II)